LRKNQLPRAHEFSSSLFKFGVALIFLPRVSSSTILSLKPDIVTSNRHTKNNRLFLERGCLVSTKKLERKGEEKLCFLPHYLARQKYVTVWPCCSFHNPIKGKRIVGLDPSGSEVSSELEHHSWSV
jgi:hypothetical protein